MFTGSNRVAAQCRTHPTSGRKSRNAAVVVADRVGLDGAKRVQDGCDRALWRQAVEGRPVVLALNECDNQGPAIAGQLQEAVCAESHFDSQGARSVSKAMATV